MDTNTQLTINSFRPFFSDISLTFSKIPDISLTAVKFPDISRFSRHVVTLYRSTNKNCYRDDYRSLALRRMSSNLSTGTMADTLKDGLQSDGGICRVTAMSQLTHAVNKFLFAYIILFNALSSGNISSAYVKEYLIAAIY